MEGEQVTVFPGPPAGTIQHYYDDSGNDSDITVTVPPGHIWHVDFMQCRLNFTATVGNRILWIYVKDPNGDTIWAALKTGNITASQCAISEWGQQASVGTTAANLIRYDNGTAPNVAAYGPLPKEGLWLVAGSTIRFYDTAAIDAAADDMWIIISYIDYVVGRA